MIRVFLSRPLWVKPHVAKHLLELNAILEEMDFEVRTVGATTTPLTSPFDEVVKVLQDCQCSIVLGLPFLRVQTGMLRDKAIEKGFALPSEWNQIEAAISLMLAKPTLMMLHRGVAPRGLFDRGAANVFIHQFDTIGPRWIKDIAPKLGHLKLKAIGLQ